MYSGTEIMAVDTLRQKLALLETEREDTLRRVTEIDGTIIKLRKKIDLATLCGDDALVDSLVASEGAGYVKPSPVPALMTDPGYPGQTAVDGSYLYICIEPNSWRRLPHVAWSK